MPRSKTEPSYRFHISGQAVVTFCGQNFYLGEYDSPESKAKYHALLGEYLANGMTAAPCQEIHQADQPVTVRCLTSEYLKHAAIKYARSYQELKRAEGLCRTLDDEYADTPADQFGPIKLGELRDLFVASGNSRRYANRQTNAIINIFRYGVSRELVDIRVVEKLRTLEPLRYGQTKAPETDPVMPVDIETVRLTAQHLSPTLKAMVRIQAATGMRSGEVCIMRPMDIEKREDGVWLYKPASHKGTHRGKTKAVPLVGDAKLALKPFLNRALDAYCFSPRESMEWFRNQQRAKRKSKVQPSQISRKKANPKKQPSERFKTDSYYRAVKNAAKKAGTDHWHPHQLRHTAASTIREALGIEYATAMLGHSRTAMTEHYAKLSEAKAIEAAKVAPSIG